VNFPQLRLTHSLGHWFRRWYELPDVQIARACLRAWLYRVKQAGFKALHEFASTALSIVLRSSSVSRDIFLFHATLLE
jgi:hypothetical protein